MARPLHALIRWEFEENYRFPILEVIVVLITILVLSSGKPAIQFNSLQSLETQVGTYLAWRLDLYFPLGMLLIGVLLSNSLAGSLERGEAKLLLSYPLSRSKVILTKLGVNFFTFFFLYLMIGVWTILSLAPIVFFTPVFLIISGGIALYLLFFTGVFALTALGTKSVKSSLILNVLLTLMIFSLSRQFLRAFGFFLTLTVSYGEIVWEGFSFSSNIPVPFPPVLVIHIIIGFATLIVAVVYFTKMLEVS